MVFLVAFMKVRNNNFLEIVKMDEAIFVTLLISGFLLIVTACVGGIAVSTQNHCMSMFYGFMALCIMLIYLALGISVLVVMSKYLKYPNNLGMFLF
jgi:hypothetical protein